MPEIHDAWFPVVLLGIVVAVWVLSRRARKQRPVVPERIEVPREDPTVSIRGVRRIPAVSREELPEPELEPAQKPSGIPEVYSDGLGPRPELPDDWDEYRRGMREWSRG